MSDCNSTKEITHLEYDEHSDVVAIGMRSPKLRFTDYAITDNIPGFWIQHASNGFVCGIPYDKDNNLLRTKALAIAQKICTALEQYDENTSTI